MGVLLLLLIIINLSVIHKKLFTFFPPKKFVLLVATVCNVEIITHDNIKLSGKKLHNITSSIWNIENSFEMEILSGVKVRTEKKLGSGDKLLVGLKSFSNLGGDRKSENHRLRCSQCH